LTQLAKDLEANKHKPYLVQNDTLKRIKDVDIKSQKCQLEINSIRLKQTKADKHVIAHRENDIDDPTDVQKNHIDKAYNLLLDVESLHQTHFPSSPKIIDPIYLAYVEDYYDEYNNEQSTNKKSIKTAKLSRPIEKSAVIESDDDGDDDDDETSYEFNPVSTSASKPLKIDLMQELNELKIAIDSDELSKQIEVNTHFAEYFKMLAKSFRIKQFISPVIIKDFCKSIISIYPDFLEDSIVSKNISNIIVNSGMSFAISDYFYIAKLFIKLATHQFNRLKNETKDDVSNLENSIMIASQHIQTLLDKTITNEDYRRLKSEMRRDRVKKIIISKYGEDAWETQPWKKDNDEGKDENKRVIKKSAPALELERLKKRVIALSNIQNDLNQLISDFKDSNFKRPSTIDFPKMHNDQHSDDYSRMTLPDSSSKNNEVVESPKSILSVTDQQKEKQQPTTSSNKPHLYRSHSLNTLFNSIRIQERATKRLRYGRPEKGYIKLNNT